MGALLGGRRLVVLIGGEEVPSVDHLEHLEDALLLAAVLD